jgi:hypothetical protein
MAQDIYKASGERTVFDLNKRHGFDASESSERWEKSTFERSIWQADMLKYRQRVIVKLGRII